MHHVHMSCTTLFMYCILENYSNSCFIFFAKQCCNIKSINEIFTDFVNSKTIVIITLIQNFSKQSLADFFFSFFR